MQEKFAFNEVNDDVNALCWIPDSATEMIVATEDSLMICDTRFSSWPVRNHIEEQKNNAIIGIKFDPYDKHRFAAFTQNMIKIYDLRIPKPQYILKYKEGDHIRGIDWSHYRQSLIASYSQNSDEIRFWDLNNHESEQARQDYFKTASKSGPKEEQAANANAEKEANMVNDLDQKYTVHTDQPTKVSKASGDVQALVWRQKPANGQPSQEQSKFFVLTRSEVIEELNYGDQARNIFDWSSRG